jgi:hypothetical protein
MAGPLGTQVGFGSADQLITVINTALSQKPPESVLYPRISWVNNSAPGVKAIFPLMLATEKEKVKGWTEARDWTDPYILKLAVEEARIDLEHVKWSIEEDVIDPYGVLKSSSNMLVNAAIRMWDRQLAQLINANGLCYDGVSFFNTAHPVQVGNAALGTYTNDLANNDLDEAGLTAALQALNDIKGANGNLYHANLGTPLLVVPNWQLELKARKLLNAGLIGKVVIAATSAASESTQLVGAADLVKLEELNDLSVNNANKRWYLMRTNVMPHGPFITRIARQPRYDYSGKGGVLDVMYAAQGYYGSAYGGVGYGLPQTIVRSTTP